MTKPTIILLLASLLVITLGILGYVKYERAESAAREARRVAQEQLLLKEAADKEAKAFQEANQKDVEVYRIKPTTNNSEVLRKLQQEAQAKEQPAASGN